MNDQATAQPGLQNYVIRGGREGRDRLRVLGRVLAPTTSRLLDGIRRIDGARVLDVGCGGGDVSFELARRVGGRGHVLGIDLDDAKLALAREDSRTSVSRPPTSANRGRRPTCSLSMPVSS